MPRVIYNLIALILVFYANNLFAPPAAALDCPPKALELIQGAKVPSLDQKIATVHRYLNGEKFEPPAYQTFKETVVPIAQGLSPRRMKLFGLPHSRVNHLPKRMRRFFNPWKNGAFEFRTKKPVALSLENGDEPLAAIRINFGGPLSKLDMLLDQKRALAKIPDLNLWIVTGKHHQAPDGSFTVDYLEKWRAKLPPEMGNRVHIVESMSQDNIWAQDGTKTMKRSILFPWIESNASEKMRRSMERFGDSAQALQSAGKTTVEDAPFYFEGGNIVVGARHLFVGPRTVEHVMEQYRISRSEAKQFLSAYFGKQVLEFGAPIPGGVLAPIHFHADLSLAVARDRNKKDEVVVIDSPRMTFEKLLGFPKLETLSSKEFRDRCDEAIIKHHITNDSLVALLKDITLPEVILRIKQLEFARREIEQQGYRTQDIPGLTLLRSQRQKNGNEEIDVEDRQFDAFNYTNVILSGQHALVPDLGAPLLDNAAHKIYEDLGYEVIGMESSARTFCHLGGIRCISETHRQ